MAACQNCYCCGKLISDGEEKKRRSRLDKKVLQSLLQVLASLVTEVSSGVDVDKRYGLGIAIPLSLR